MSIQRKACGFLAVLTCSFVLHAQDFKFFNRTVQMHGFASQGYAYSNQNNFMTMNTSHGSPALTEGAVNVSMSVNDKFRIGAQGYSRKIGSFDDFRPQLDWAYADFKAASWLGFRGGKVKTVLGLYNDTQDMAFLYPWALLPQGVYPTDLRSTLIAHTGADIYGRLPLRKLGKLEYTVYGGQRSYDDRDGVTFFTQNLGLNLLSINGITEGGDLKWLPKKNLTLGVSSANLTQHRHVLSKTYEETLDSTPNRLWAGYADFAPGKLDLSFEYRSQHDIEKLVFIFPKLAMSPLDKSTNDWFASASYRITPKMQAGVYHSNWVMLHPTTPTNTASNHIHDEVGALRYDVNRFWDVKAEGHFMDGYGDSRQAQGFYTQWNTKGLKPKTNLLVLRATFKF